MGGHGGLNILPQKRWNVYNFDNREKVRRDEEQAAREEQLKREQARKRDSELRLDRLRAARGLAPPPLPEPVPEPKSEPDSEPRPSSDAGHINLFEGIKIFDPIREPPRENADGPKNKKMKKEEPRVVGPEDEKYKLGYGLAGKGVQLPWYLHKPSGVVDDEDEKRDGGERSEHKGDRKKKKTLEELREERLKREKKEKDRERALRREKQQSRDDVHRSRRFTR